MIKSLIVALIVFLPVALTYNSTIINKIGGGDKNGISFDFTNVLRGIAILIIMIGHISGTMGTVAFSPLGGIGVALFLFLSGFGLNESWKKHGSSKYWNKKIRRVFIPYFIVISIIAIIGGHKSLHGYLLDIFGIKTSYWYIGYLLKWYLIFWLTSRFTFKYRMQIMGVCALGFLFILPNIEAEQSFSFLAGVWTSISIDKYNRITAKQMISIGVIAFIVGTVFLGIKQLPAIRIHIDDYIYNIVQLFIKLPYAISIMSIIWLFPIIQHNRFLLFAGAISYELYLVHMPFYGDVNGSIPYALLLIVTSICAAKIFNIFNSKVAKIDISRYCKHV